MERKHKSNENSFVEERQEKAQASKEAEKKAQENNG